MFVAVSVASVVRAQCGGPVDTFLRTQGGYPATPTISGCGYILVGVVLVGHIYCWWLHWSVWVNDSGIC